MNGHRELITMRRAGFKPDVVYVADYPCHTDWAKWGDQPTICVAGDTPELQDFRFVVGTTVLVDGEDAERVSRIARACGAHAKRVISNVFKRVNDARLELIRIEDTDGFLTWPK